MAKTKPKGKRHSSTKKTKKRAPRKPRRAAAKPQFAAKMAEPPVGAEEIDASPAAAAGGCDLVCKQCGGRIATGLVDEDCQDQARAHNKAHPGHKAKCDCA